MPADFETGGKPPTDGLPRLIRAYSRIHPLVCDVAIKAGKDYAFVLHTTDIRFARPIGTGMALALGRLSTLPPGDPAVATTLADIATLFKKITDIFKLQTTSGDFAGTWDVVPIQGLGQYASSNLFWIGAITSAIMQYERMGMVSAADQALLRSGITLAAQFSSKYPTQLVDHDFAEANHLFTNVLGFILAGIYTGNDQFFDMGERFLSICFENVDKEGVLIEDGGFDGCYQGVSLALIGELCMMYQSGRAKELFLRATRRYLPIFLSNGLVSTVGTRMAVPGKPGYPLDELTIPLWMANEICPELGADRIAYRFQSVAIQSNKIQDWSIYTDHVLPSIPTTVQSDLANRDFLTETITWANAANAAGRVSPRSLASTDKFVRALKDQSLWTKFARINLFVGHDVTTLAYPLLDPAVPETEVSCLPSDYWEREGFKGNAASVTPHNYFDTHYVPSSASGGLLANVKNTITAGYVLGSSSDASHYYRLGIASGVIGGSWGYNTADQASYTGSFTKGFYHVQRNSGDTGDKLKLYRNGGLLASAPGTATPTATTNSLYMMATHDTTGMVKHASAVMSSYGILKDPVSPAEAATLYTLFKQFDRDVGRDIIFTPNYANDETRTWINAVWALQVTCSDYAVYGLDEYITSMKTLHLWETKTFIWPCISDRLKGALVALQYDEDEETWVAVNLVNHGFVDADYDPYTGLGGGGSKYLETTLSSLGVKHLTVYGRDFATTTQTQTVAFGVGHTCITRTGPGTKTIGAKIRSSNKATDAPAGNPPPKNGHYLGAVISGTIYIYENGTSAGSVSQDTPTLTDYNMLLFARGGSGDPTLFETGHLCFASAGSDLTDDLAKKDYACTQALQRWLCRAVTKI